VIGALSSDFDFSAVIKRSFSVKLSIFSEGEKFILEVFLTVFRKFEFFGGNF
jgi:hypothetical protein